jgi:hypothetical protein
LDFYLFISALEFFWRKTIYFYIYVKDLLVIYMFKSNFDVNYPNNIN